MKSRHTEDSDKLLFVFGPARGGTTFLANLLTKWLGYADAPEGQFVAPFLKRHSALQGQLNGDDMQRLAEELAGVTMLRIIRERWPEDLAFDVSSQDILDNANAPSLDGLIFGVFASVAKHRGAVRVGNKNPDYWKVLPQLHRFFGDRARYLFIQRDGRDVYLSQDKQAWGGQSIYAAAKSWRKMSSAVRDFSAQYPGEVLSIRYEDLLSDPQEVFPEIARFVGCGEDEVGVITGNFVADNKENALADNYDKWIKGMSDAEVGLFEKAAGGELQAWGYQCHDSRSSGNIFLDAYYGMLEFVRLIRLNLYVLLNDYMPADKEKWQNKSGLARLLGRWLYSRKN